MVSRPRTSARWACETPPTRRSLPARAPRTFRVVTKDHDFFQLLERNGPPPRVVWITAGNLRNRELRAVLQRHWLRVAKLLAKGVEPLVEIGGGR
jgi:predicted nuclease of predicted toxin-antitoxin system